MYKVHVRRITVLVHAPSFVEKYLLCMYHEEIGEGRLFPSRTTASRGTQTDRGLIPSASGAEPRLGQHLTPRLLFSRLWTVTRT